MDSEVRLSHLDGLLASVEYPATTAEIHDVFEGVTLLYADGEESAEAVLDRVGDAEFESPTDLKDALLSNVSMEAVGEPGQSEGEG